jgi:hypothetical protein
MELFHQATCRMKVFNLFLNEALAFDAAGIVNRIS